MADSHTTSDRIEDLADDAPLAHLVQHLRAAPDLRW
jgi:hypothetical protein